MLTQIIKDLYAHKHVQIHNQLGTLTQYIHKIRDKQIYMHELIKMICTFALLNFVNSQPIYFEF